MRPLAYLISVAIVCNVAGCAIAPRDDGLTPAEAVQAKRIEFQQADAGNRVRDDALEAYLGRTLAALDPHPTSPIVLYVIDDPTPQADLLANRVLRLRLSLLLALRSEDELLFVMAHELAHRDLDHLSARRGSGWNPAAAEREADGHAVATLRRLGRRASAGVELLARLSTDANDAAYRHALADRIEGLRRIEPDAPPQPLSEWPLDAILEPYRDGAER
jgi:hypothetical protein